MSTFEILLAGDDDSHVVTADAYAQEGPLTTFFCCESTHVRLDSWAERLASFRSAEIRAIRRLDTGKLSLRHGRRPSPVGSGRPPSGSEPRRRRRR